MAEICFGQEMLQVINLKIISQNSMLLNQKNIVFVINVLAHHKHSIYSPVHTLQIRNASILQWHTELTKQENNCKKILIVPSDICSPLIGVIIFKPISLQFSTAEAATGPPNEKHWRACA